MAYRFFSRSILLLTFFGFGTLAAAQKQGDGAISGIIRFPSEENPPLRIYALAGTGKSQHATTTTPKQARFTIEGLPAGQYFIVAYPISDAGEIQAGGWTRFVQCGMKVQCTDHSLIPVTVAASKTTTGVDVSDWDTEPGTFPPEPVQRLQGVASRTDCGKKSSQIEEDSCNMVGYEEADKTLNREYKRILAVLEKLPKCKERLREAQRAWVKFRDEHCAYEGVTGYKGRTTECLRELTEQRADYLSQQAPDLCRP